VANQIETIDICPNEVYYIATMSAVVKKTDSMPQSLHFLIVFLIALFLACSATGKLAWSAELSITSDRESIRLISENPSQPPSQEKSSPVAREGGEETANPAQLQKEAELRRIAAPLDEEELLMRAVVQTLDRKSAARWLGTFISSKP